MTVMATEPEKWMVDTNDRYSKIIATVTSLATGSLLLPALFLREFLGVPKEQALVPFLNCWAYAGWGSLGLSISFGLLYSWLSVKWIKSAWGQPTVLSQNILEQLMNWSFALVLLLFLAGVSLSVRFFITARPF
jgi:hypothetical protein